MNLPFYAMRFARNVHQLQRRKFTGNPYSDHLAEVCGIVSTVDSRDFVLATAWLHDTIEDCGVTHEDLESQFGLLVADGVMLLSDLEVGNRETRKHLSRERLKDAPRWIQNIKVADITSNTSGIIEHDTVFANVYLREKMQMLDVLKNAEPYLVDMAKKQVFTAWEALQAVATPLRKIASNKSAPCLC